MKALVTGGAGFIGSTLVDRLLAEGHAVDVVDDLSTGSLANLSASRADRSHHLSFHQLDVRQPGVVDLIGRRAPEVIFHLAAQADVRVGQNYRLTSDPSAFRGKDQAGFAVNPANPQHIVEANANYLSEDCEATASFDGGVTWTEAAPLTPPTPAIGLPFLPSCRISNHLGESMFQTVAFGTGMNVYTTAITPRAAVFGEEGAAKFEQAIKYMTDPWFGYRGLAGKTIIDMIKGVPTSVGNVTGGDDALGLADDLAGADDLDDADLLDVVLEALDRDEVAVGEGDHVVGENGYGSAGGLRDQYATDAQGQRQRGGDERLPPTVSGPRRSRSSVGRTAAAF